MKTGDLVRFTNPEADERDVRFTVLEMRGDRVLVEFVCDMPIAPTFVYLTADLTKEG